MSSMINLPRRWRIEEEPTVSAHIEGSGRLAERPETVNSRRDHWMEFEPLPLGRSGFLSQGKSRVRSKLVSRSRSTTWTRRRASEALAHIRMCDSLGSVSYTHLTL